MREILFRIKDRISEEWYYGFPLNEVSASGFVSFQGKDTHGGSYFDALADASALCQYTGLTDKNGKKIFEGDIVKFAFKSNKARQIGKVYYSKGMFVFDNGLLPVSYDEIYAVEVLGNIFDNANLLKK